MEAREHVRIALFGNSFASRIQLPALRWAGGNEVIGVAGRDFVRAQETASAWKIETATTEWRRLLEGRPDLVLVTTPVDLHHEMTLAALESGAAVLCEKPFAMDASQAQEMVVAGEGRGAWIDHELRWSPQLRRMRECIQEGFVGDPWQATIEMSSVHPQYRQRPFSWWFDEARGGGMLGALGSHLLDLLRWMLGEVVAVEAELATFISPRPDAEGTPRPVTADEHVDLRLRFENGALGELSTSAVVPGAHRFFFQVTGSAGTLRLVDGESLSGGRAGEDLAPIETAPLPTSEQLGMPEYSIFGRCLPLFLKDLIDSLRSGDPLDEAADFSDGLAVQRILDAARSSHRNDSRWVELQ